MNQKTDMQFHPLYISEVIRICANNMKKIVTTTDCIVFIQSGNGKIKNANFFLNYSTGDAFFISKGLDIQNLSTKGPKIILIKLKILHIDFINSLSHQIFLLPRSSIVIDNLNKFSKIQCNENKEKEILTLAIEAVLFSHVSIDLTENSLIFDIEANKIQKQLDSFIEKHINQSFPVEELARSVCRSTKRLNSFLLQQFGYTLVDYVNHYKLRKAKKMLYFSDRSITEIAYACGFGSVHYFSRKFKETNGVSPQAFKPAVIKK